MRWLVVLALVLATARAASAYPHFQLTSGTARCSQCHLTPAGGGLLSAWGREETADTVSGGGDGRFLHGAVELPAWLVVGGHVRVAALANETGSSDGVELAVFPMQLDLAARVNATSELSLTAVAGVRGAVRSGAPRNASEGPGTATAPSFGSYLVARELYAMWHAESGGYGRVGRFAAPYGLRLADHTAYVRRYLGYNLLEETVGFGGGYIADSWELHATAFTHDRLQDAARRESGGALMFELVRGDLVAGASARSSLGPDDTRVQAGVHGKLWLERARLLLLGELDGVRQAFAADGERYQLAAYAGPVLVPARGVYAGLAYEAFAEDLAVRGVLRQAISVWGAWLPRAHWELMMSARAQRIGPRENAAVALLQVHYYL